MAIKGNQTAIVTILASDTVALNPSDGRAAITFASLENTTVDTVYIEAFKATSGTPAAIDRIWSKKLVGGESSVPAELLATIPEGGFLVLKADAGNGSKVNLNLSYTQYSGDD